MKRILSACLLSTLAVATANADTVEFNNRANFMANSSHWTVLDFENIIPPGPAQFFEANTPQGLNVGLMNLNATVNHYCCPVQYLSAVFRNGFAGFVTPGSNDFFSGAYSRNDGFSGIIVGTVILTPLAPTRALGFDYLAYEPLRYGSPPVTFTITLSNGHTYRGSSNRTSQFLGFITSTPIEWMRIQYDVPAVPFSVTARLGLDNMTFAPTVTSTPEPATFGLLLGTGLIGYAANKLRNRR